MKSGTKVLLETIRVARHVGQLGLRPLEKVALKAAKAGEDVTLWTLRLPPVEEALGRERKQQALDAYFKAKDVVRESVAALGHQSLMSALQSGAEGATACLRQAGIQTRVVGPFDVHWNVRKILNDFRNSEGRAAALGKGVGALQLTPKRFVQFMREAEQTKRRGLQRDPVEDYIDWIMTNGSVRAMGPVVLERKLYKDVVRLICFAFDRSLTEANGADVWGHMLRVKVRREFGGLGSKVRRARTKVGLEQVEAVVDQMLQSPDLEVPVFMAGMQRLLLVNCSMTILQLLEELISDRHLQVSMLGHELHVRLEKLPLDHILQRIGDASSNSSPQFPVNTQAVDELVDALIDEPEVQLVLVPDLVESEVYRIALHRMLCIAQFILQQVRIRLFGAEVRLSLLPDQPTPAASDGMGEDGVPCVQVPQEELQRLLNQIQDERRRIDRELRARRGEPESSSASPDKQLTLQEEGNVQSDTHEFHTMAAQDRLSRSLAVQRTISVPIELAFQMVSDFNAYNNWMPFCTSARVLSTEEDGKIQMCEVGFGLETGTMLGTVGDKIRYQVRLHHPTEDLNQLSPQRPEALRVARVVADTHDGFRYGKRLVYDWRFIETAVGETDVRLDMFFQARSVLFLPLWDSMQATITSVMMKKFQERAGELMASDQKK